MILKKIIINNKVMYEPISTIEAINYQNKTELIFSSDDEKDEFEEMLEKYEEAISKIEELELRLEELDGVLEKEKQQNILNKIESFKASLYNKAADIEAIINELDSIEDDLEELDDDLESSRIQFNGENINLNTAFNKINGIFSNTKKSNNKVDKLLEALPFMEPEDLSELVDDILKNKENYKELDFEAIFPFLNTSDCDRLFMMAINKEIDCSLITLAPFVSQEALSKLVDEYINGKYKDLEMSQLYPFLRNTDVKKLFNYILKS